MCRTKQYVKQMEKQNEKQWQTLWYNQQPTANNQQPTRNIARIIQTMNIRFFEKCQPIPATW